MAITSRPLKLIRVLADFALGASVLAIVLLTASLVGSLFRAPFAAYAPLNVDIASRSSTGLSVSLTSPPDFPIRLWNVRGQLEPGNLPRRVQAEGQLLFLASLAAFALAVHLFRGFLKSVVDGDIFTDANTSRLRRIGAIAVALGVLTPLAQGMLASAALAYVKSETLQLSAGSSIDGSFVIGGLFLLVLAEVWRHGVELQQEQDSTV